MNNKKIILLILLALPIAVFGQVFGFIDDFEDGILTGWEVSEEHQRTFELTEENGILKIDYHRTAESWEWDNINFTPPEEINVSDNPTITVKVKSDVATVMTFKPIYGNGSDDWLQKNVPADNQWHDYTFDLESFGSSNLTMIYIYLDGGSTSISSGLVCFDDLVIGTGEFVLKVDDLDASVIDSSTIGLDWSCNDTGMVDHYRIFRDVEPDLECTADYLLDSCNLRNYSDSGLAINTTYYYKVTAIDTAGVQTGPSNEALARTYQPGEGPVPYIQSVSSNYVGCYDKFEVKVGLENTNYDNPYDPEEIDLRAYFISPSDSVWMIYGFYDNYQDADQWKIRFSPNEVGMWSFHIEATDIYGTGQSQNGSFQALATSYHGWIRSSDENHHYFEYDDGLTFFGVGAYNPWNMTGSELNNLGAHGGNVVGFWNIMYDVGEIIESLDSGLGRYDQPKCGRIDQIITWAEQKDLKAMFAIWPHDLISNTVWSHQWHQNPYNTICSVDEFYSSEEAWEYQKKQYRYLIARWGYSRGLGIWELVNEINGTDGWQNGYIEEAEMWTGRAADFFRENDPFRHPATASQSGGIFWGNGYDLVAIQNMHMYETQAMPAHYPSNPMRSSMYVYQYNTQRFWDEFDKPAIFGEAGYTNSYGNYSPGSANYTRSYHNSIWASWSNGISMTPIWWDYGILSDNDLDQMKAFSDFINTNLDYLDFAHIDYEPLNITASGCDAFGMESDTMAFGWMREIGGNSITGKSFSMNNLAENPYSVKWYNTWTGDLISTSLISPVSCLLSGVVPAIPADKPDVAFIVKPAELGDTPENLVLTANPISLLNVGNSISTITCIIRDEEGRFCGNAVNEITFSVIGSGDFTSTNVINAVNGKATIDYQSPSETGIEKIIANSPGLQPDTVEIEITNQFIFDDFENYTSNSDLSDVWKVKTGCQVNIDLEHNNVFEGVNSLKMHYNISAPPYAGIYRNINAELTGMNYLGIWYKPAKTNRGLVIRLKEQAGAIWEYSIALDSYDPAYLEIPFSDFVPFEGSAENIDLSKINEISLNILKGNGELGEALIYFDNITFLTTQTTDIRPDENRAVFEKYCLMQNYPNPFNKSTTIQYSLAVQAKVELSIYNMNGQIVKKLVDSVQNPGYYMCSWNCENIATGVYFYKLQVGDFVSFKKCILLK